MDDEQVQGDLLARCEARIAELERKVGKLVMENDLLKKKPPVDRAARRSLDPTRLSADEPGSQHLLLPAQGAR